MLRRLLDVLSKVKMSYHLEYLYIIRLGRHHETEVSNQRELFWLDRGCETAATNVMNA